MEIKAPIAGAQPPAFAGLGTRWRIIGLLFLIYTINCIDRMSLSVGLPIISKEFALSATIQGIILSAFFWTYSGCQIPGGWLVDRFGARRVLTVATIVWGFFQATAAAATSGTMLLLTRVGLGVFEAPFMPGASKLSAAWLPPTERSRGVTLIDSGAPLGSALGGLIISGLILFFGSWRLAFLAMGVLTVVFGGVLYFVIRNTPREHDRVSAEEIRLIEGTAATLAPKPRPLSTRTFLAMVFGRIGWAMIFFGFVTWGPNYLSAARGMDIKGLGLSTFAIFLAGTAGEIASGILADRLQRTFSRDISFKILFGLSGLVSLGCMLYLPYVGDPVAAVFVLCVGVLFHLFGGLYWSIPAMLASPERIGLVGGVMNFAGTSSGITVPIIVGLIVDHTGGFDAVLNFFAACALVYLIGSLLIDFRPAPTQETAR
jgi:ACS family D-galactonate transporter-like MFS transporter